MDDSTIIEVRELRVLNHKIDRIWELQSQIQSDLNIMKRAMAHQNDTVDDISRTLDSILLCHERKPAGEEFDPSEGGRFD